MSVEIEAKMRLDDPTELLERLTERGGRFVENLYEINTYFDTPEGDLKTTDQGLRIRVEQPEAGPARYVITHKGPRAHSDLKVRREIETLVSDPNDAASLLQVLGYHPVLSFEKRRRRWSYGGCHVDIDELPHIGNFVEIEGPSDEVVVNAARDLGLEDLAIVKASYIAMLQAFVLEQGVELGETLRLPNSPGKPPVAPRVPAKAG